MRAAGEAHRPSPVGKLISLAVLLIAIGLGVSVLRRNAQLPSTDAATIDADVVHVAALVSGRIIDIPVAENKLVAKGDLLFRIDPVPYRLLVEQAEADLDLAEAALDSQRRVLSTQRSAAVVAREQTLRAATNLELASRTVERLSPLANQGYVPKQQLDQAQTAQRDGETSLRQAQEQEVAAENAIGTEEGAKATVRARKAALGIAQRALEDTTVRATHAGRVTGLTVSTGEIVAPSQTLFTVINTEDWFAVANFRETDMVAIAPGDCATVFSMVNREIPIRGIVEGLGYGVLDTDRVNLPRSLPYVERSLNWVRVAQRFPVRVRLEKPPEQLVRLGASAVVEVKHGQACR
jgi:membrane fusion protein, multidrug efflux system